MNSKPEVSLPVHQPDRPGMRPSSEIREMALAVQANLAILRRLDARRHGLPINRHEIQVPSPRRVDRFRETLIDPIMAASYSEMELRLRLREIWGRYCALCWLFHAAGEPAVDFSKLTADAPLECLTSLEIKLAEVHAFLWRFRYEQERRDSKPIGSTSSDEHGELARRIPARTYGKKVDDCTAEEILLASCEHAGMLAVLRWASDCRLAWDAPGIMEAGTSPFQ